MILVSHSLEQISEYCKKSIFLLNGELQLYGPTMDVANSYLKFVYANDEEALSELPKESDKDEDKSEKNEWGDLQAKIKRVVIKTDQIVTHSPLHIELLIDNRKLIENLNCGIGIYSSKDEYISGVNTKFDNFQMPSSEEISITLIIPDLTANPGQYYLRISLFSENENTPHHFLHKVIQFNIGAPREFTRGLVTFSHTWEV